MSLSSCRLADAALPKQRIESGLPAPERDVRVHDVTAAANLEDLLAKARRRPLVEYARLFEGGKCVRRKNLCPLVTVVTGRVSAGKNVGEAVRQAVVAGMPDQGHVAANLVQDIEHSRTACRIEFRVHAKVEQREFELAQH